MNRSTPGLSVHHQLLEFTQTHVHQVSDVIQPSHPLSSPSPPAPNTPQHQRFSNQSTLHMRWPKYWNFSFSVIPSKEIPWLISFRTDWLAGQKSNKKHEHQQEILIFFFLSSSPVSRVAPEVELQQPRQKETYKTRGETPWFWPKDKRTRPL